MCSNKNHKQVKQQLTLISATRADNCFLRCSCKSSIVVMWLSRSASWQRRLSTSDFSTATCCSASWLERSLSATDCLVDSAWHSSCRVILKGKSSGTNETLVYVMLNHILILNTALQHRIASPIITRSCFLLQRFDTAGVRSQMARNL